MGCATSSPETTVTSQQMIGTANYARTQTVVHHPGQYPQQVRYPQQPLGPPPVYYNQQQYPVQQTVYSPQFIVPNTTVVQHPQTVVYQAAGTVMSNGFHGPRYYNRHVRVRKRNHFFGGFGGGGGGGGGDGGGGCGGGGGDGGGGC